MSRNDVHSRSQTRNTCILPRLYFILFIHKTKWIVYLKEHFFQFRINSRTGAFSSLDNLNNTNLNASMDTIKEEGNEAGDYFNYSSYEKL